jgi:hypothetical protein
MRDRRVCPFRMLAVVVTSTVFEQFKCLTTALVRATKRSSMALDVFAIKRRLA